MAAMMGGVMVNGGADWVKSDLGVVRMGATGDGVVVDCLVMNCSLQHGWSFRH